MQKDLRIFIDHSTWPKAGGPKPPPSFPSIPFKRSFNIPSVLLLLGNLTTPSFGDGVSLSEYWAWVRYLQAIAAQTDLLVSAPFAALDAHQKTILSDDFGVAFPMHYLK